MSQLWIGPFQSEMLGGREPEWAHDGRLISLSRAQSGAPTLDAFERGFQNRQREEPADRCAERNVAHAEAIAAEKRIAHQPIVRGSQQLGAALLQRANLTRVARCRFDAYELSKECDEGRMKGCLVPFHPL